MGKKILNNSSYIILSVYLGEMRDNTNNKKGVTMTNVVVKIEKSGNRFNVGILMVINLPHRLVLVLERHFPMV